MLGIAILETARHGAASIAGLVVSCLGILLMCYGLSQFRWRLRKIMRKDPAGYDDTIGPIVLVSVLVTGMLMYLALKFFVITSSSDTTTAVPIKAGAAPVLQRDYAFEERVLERLELISRALGERSQPLAAQ
jgi:hypothetical protein